MERHHSPSNEADSIGASYKSTPILPPADDLSFWPGNPVLPKQLSIDPVSMDDNEFSSNVACSPKARTTARSHRNPLLDWSSHTSPHLSEDPRQSRSRYPGLMSNSTLSSGNSFTRSTRSLESLEWKGKAILVCDFCDASGDHATTFEGANLVSEFLEHLMQSHNADEPEVEIEEPIIHPVYKVAVGVTRRYIIGPKAQCPLCGVFATARTMYEHVPKCVSLQAIRMAEVGIRPRLSFMDIVCGTSSDATTDRRAPVPLPDEGYPPMQRVEVSSQDSSEHSHAGCEDITELTAPSSRLSLVSSSAATPSEQETDSAEEMASRESSPAALEAPHRLTPTKRLLVDAIMRDFQQVFRTSLRSHTSKGNPGTGGRASGSSTGAFTYSGPSFVSRKRSLSGGSFTPPEDGDDSNKRRRPDFMSKGEQPASQLRFACPYYKRNPGRHQTYTSCRDPGFITVARLKEHLYRRHLLPPQCHRCCTTFADDVALREHQRDPGGCELRELIPLEGFDKEQEKKMKSKKGSQVHHGEVEKWKAVYRILFPDDHDADMPSPYIEYQRDTASVTGPSSDSRFQEFSRLELPRLVRRTLESIVEHEAQPLEDRLKERLVDIVRQCQSQLETMFCTVAGPGDTIAATSSRSNAQAFRDVIEPPDNTQLPTMSSIIEPVDQHTSSTAAPLPTQLHETSYEGVALAEAAEPVSDTSDSGYETISLAALPATSVHNELPHEYFDPNQYVDLSNYSHLFEATAGTAIQVAQTHAEDDLSIWSFVDTIPVMNNENVEASHSAPSFDHISQY